MRLGNILAGQPFKTALRVLLVFLLIYSAAGWVLVRSVEQTLQAELVAQTRAESILLEGIYQENGQAGLLSALRDLERHVQLSGQASGLFDENGLSLVGPISVMPNFVGVERRELRQLTEGHLEGGYFLSVQKIDRLTLVVGRDGKMVDLAKRRLMIGLGIVGVVLAVSILSLGIWASRVSLRRLEDMERSLRQVSDGETDARLPVLGRNDQFDRVSVQMNQNLDRLSRLMIGMKSTASAIAHDLKTPLSHAQIAMHEAADACEAGKDPLPKIETALAEAEALNSVFETVLRISRIQAAPGQSGFAQVDLAHVAQKVIEFMQPLADENAQTLRQEGDAPVMVLADQTMIQQLLVNLVKNAIVHAGKETNITLSAKMSGNRPVLQVRDTGPGIRPEDRARILQPFVRLDAARTTPGSGLGLALVQAVVEHHNAEIALADMAPGLAVNITFSEV